MLIFNLYKLQFDGVLVLIYNYILDFRNETNSEEILSKIELLDENYQVWIDAPTYENL
ncbi:MAG: hypothetical protein LBE11_02430 [Prevotellaceae bacterium]|nr:hypothetical protein [Prevotellaceae bacterium]